MFRTHILERGLNYYEEGYVTSLEQTSTGYTAVVEGTEDYDVEIEIRDDRVYDMPCTCPYAEEGNYCKHMAAVLYEIEEGEPDTKIPGNYLQKVQEQNKELQEIIAGIPIDELQEIVFSQANSDEFLYNRIMTKYAPITPCHMIRLKQRVNDIGYHYSDRGGFVDYYHATDYTDALNTLLDENVPLLLEKNYRMEAFECMQRDLEYIVKLKKLCSETEWEEQREKFLQGKTSYWIRYEFLVEEELFERLLQEIQKNQSVHVLDQYEKVLKKHLPNEVRDMYVQYVKKESTRTADRKAYKYLMSYLKKITKYPDGKKIAGDIADCWKQDYKRRPAMMDELRKAGF